MHVVIAGGGRVGAQTARYLVDRGHTATIIEQAESMVANLPTDDGIEVIVGDAVSPEPFETVALGRAEVFAALTGDTNVNVAACYIAQSGDESVRTVARIAREDEREYNSHDAIDAVVFPEAAGAATATGLITGRTSASPEDLLVDEDDEHQDDDTSDEAGQ